MFQCVCSDNNFFLLTETEFVKHKNPPEEESTGCLSQDIIWHNISKLPWDTPNKLQNGVSSL